MRVWKMHERGGAGVMKAFVIAVYALIIMGGMRVNRHQRTEHRGISGSTSQHSSELMHVAGFDRSTCKPHTNSHVAPQSRSRSPAGGHECFPLTQFL